jgi:hypothetical protein
MEDVARKRAEAGIISSMIAAANTKNGDWRHGQVAPQAGVHSIDGAQSVPGGGSGGLPQNGVPVSAAGRVPDAGCVDNPFLAQAAVAANFPSPVQPTAALPVTPALAMQTAASTYPSSGHASSSSSSSAAAAAAAAAAAIFPSLADSNQTAASNHSPAQAVSVTSGPNPPEPDGLRAVGGGPPHQASAVAQVESQPVTSNVGVPVPLVAQPLPSSLSHLGVPVVAHPMPHGHGVSHVDVPVVAASPVTTTGDLGAPVVAQVLAQVAADVAGTGEGQRRGHSDHHGIAKVDSEAGLDRINAKTRGGGGGSEPGDMAAAQTSDAGRNGCAVETAGRCCAENAAKNGGTYGPAKDGNSQGADGSNNSASAAAAIEQHKPQKPSTSVKDGTPRALS